MVKGTLALLWRKLQEGQGYLQTLRKDLSVQGYDCECENAQGIVSVLKRVYF